MPHESKIIKPTGIPPHIYLMLKMESLTNSMSTFGDNITTLKKDVLQGFSDILEEKAISASTITRDGMVTLLDQQLQQQMQKFKLPELLDIVQELRAAFQSGEHNISHCNTAKTTSTSVSPANP